MNKWQNMALWAFAIYGLIYMFFMPELVVKVRHLYAVGFLMLVILKRDLTE